MSKPINVEMTTEELRVVVSVLEGNPLHFRGQADRKAGGSGVSVETAMQRQLADRLSLLLAKQPA